MGQILPVDAPQRSVGFMPESTVRALGDKRLNVPCRKNGQSSLRHRTANWPTPPIGLFVL